MFIADLLIISAWLIYLANLMQASPIILCIASSYPGSKYQQSMDRLIGYNYRHISSPWIGVEVTTIGISAVHGQAYRLQLQAYQQSMDRLIGYNYRHISSPWIGIQVTTLGISAVHGQAYRLQLQEYQQSMDRRIGYNYRNISSLWTGLQVTTI